MRIEALDPSDEDAARGWYDAIAAACATDHPLVPADPWEEMLAGLRRRDPSTDQEAYVGLDGEGRTVTAARLRLPLRDNRDNALVELFVHPEHRRRGYGRQMLELVARRAGELGRKRLLAEIGQPLDVTPAEGVAPADGVATGRAAGDSPGSAFARAAGGRCVLTEVMRTLDVQTAGSAALADLRAEAVAASTGYELVRWVDACPQEWLDDLAVLIGRMSTDAPLGEMDWEPEDWDAGRVRDEEQESVECRRTIYTSAARDMASGRLVAFTRLGVSRWRPEIAYQWDTLVLREHRGHRLGLLLKLANLDLMRDHEPTTRWVHTWNAPTNTPMVAVNERMGFMRQMTWGEWQLEL